MPTRGSLPRFRADIPSGANWLLGKFAGEGWTGEPAIPHGTGNPRRHGILVRA